MKNWTSASAGAVARASVAPAGSKIAERPQNASTPLAPGRAALDALLGAQTRGCDASNEHDEELPLHEQELSDDEEEVHSTYYDVRGMQCNVNCNGMEWNGMYRSNVRAGAL